MIDAIPSGNLVGSAYNEPLDDLLHADQQSSKLMNLYPASYIPLLSNA